MEKLKTYITKSNLSVVDFATLAGIAPSTLYRAFSGESDLDKKTCQKIEVATNRKIRALHIITEQLRKTAV